LTETDDKPDWWRDNERLRSQLGLPTYQPPRFADGTYTHEVVETLETTHGCDLQFIGIDTRYPDDWEIRVDGEPAFAISRHRDEHGNTIYGMDAGSFRDAVENHLSENGETRG
jgi:hypothetical protein